jgi:hypothetical protein
VIRKAQPPHPPKKKKMFKGTKANCIPVHCYNQKGWIGRFFKIGSTSRSLGFPERERITTESSVAARQCPFSSMIEHTGF